MTKSDREISFAEFQVLKKQLDKSAENGELGVVGITIKGDSMRPWMRPREELIVRPVNVQKLKIFDPIVFWDGEAMTCHLFLRFNQFVMSNGESAVLTHGLNNSWQDRVVPVSNILGLVIKPKPWWLGFLLWWRRRGRRS